MSNILDQQVQKHLTCSCLAHNQFANTGYCLLNAMLMFLQAGPASRYALDPSAYHAQEVLPILGIDSLYQVPKSLSLHQHQSSVEQDPWYDKSIKDLHLFNNAVLGTVSALQSLTAQLPAVFLSCATVVYNRAAHIMQLPNAALMYNKRIIPSCFCSPQMCCSASSCPVMRCSLYCSPSQQKWCHCGFQVGRQEPARQPSTRAPDGVGVELLCGQQH